jgi:hypothetical protein
VVELFGTEPTETKILSYYQLHTPQRQPRIQKIMPMMPLTNEPDHDRKLAIFIAYDDITAGLRAMRLFSDIRSETGQELAFQAQPWRFDFLADPDWSEFAIADALKADLLIISATRQTEVPAGVREWLSACLSRKQGTLAAVVALLGRDDAGSSSVQFLKRASENAGLEFFAPSLQTEADVAWTAPTIHL